MIKVIVEYLGKEGEKAAGLLNIMVSYMGSVITFPRFIAIFVVHLYLLLLEKNRNKAGGVLQQRKDINYWTYIRGIMSNIG